MRSISRADGRTDTSGTEAESQCTPYVRQGGRREGHGRGGRRWSHWRQAAAPPRQWSGGRLVAPAVLFRTDELGCTS